MTVFRLGVGEAAFLHEHDWELEIDPVVVHQKDVETTSAGSI